MPQRVFARQFRSGLVILCLAAATLAPGCVYLTPRRGGNLEVRMLLPGNQTGWVSYIGTVTAAEKPDVAGAFTCFNGVDPRCEGASVSQVTGNVLAVPLVTGGAHSTITSFLEFAPLQPGRWSIIVHIAGSAAKDFNLCEVPIEANTTTLLEIESDPLATSARYRVGVGRSGKASVC